MLERGWCSFRSASSRTTVLLFCTIRMFSLRDTRSIWQGKNLQVEVQSLSTLLSICSGGREPHEGWDVQVRSICTHFPIVPWFWSRMSACQLIFRFRFCAHSGESRSPPFCCKIFTGYDSPPSPEKNRYDHSGCRKM